MARNVYYIIEKIVLLIILLPFAITSTFKYPRAKILRVLARMIHLPTSFLIRFDEINNMLLNSDLKQTAVSYRATEKSTREISKYSNLSLLLSSSQVYFNAGKSTIVLGIRTILSTSPILQKSNLSSSGNIYTRPYLSSIDLA